MANYECTTVSNEFKIKEGMEVYAKQIFENISSENGIESNIYYDKDLKSLYGYFCCYGCISGLSSEFYEDSDVAVDNDDDEYDYEIVAKELQKIVTDDSFISIMEVGNEKLRYVAAGSWIITSTHIEYVDLQTEIYNKAKNLLSA